MKMKVFFILLLVVVFQSCISTGKKENDFAKINSLLEEKNFFEAKALLNSGENEFSELELLVLEAKLNSAFNRLEDSNTKIDRIFKEFKNETSDSVQKDLLVIQTRNHGKLFSYEKAFNSINVLLADYENLLSEEEIKEFKNEREIWRALLNQLPQTVTLAQQTVLPIIRDKAQLPNLEVTTQTDTINFIFDTGANLSTVTETTARLLNMEMMEGSIEVGAITGNVIQSKLAVCPSFNLGGITVKNAVFLVFPDTALAFPQINYQINGIIGFPVIEALREIQITKSDQFIVPLKPSKSSFQNLALDFLTPIIQLNEEYYTFDSGADRTQLYEKYYEKNKSKIDENHVKIDISYGGAGGAIISKGFYISFSPEINGRKVELDSVVLFAGNPKETSKEFYGNIGQDLIKKFDKMTINFEGMFIEFE